MSSNDSSILKLDLYLSKLCSIKRHDDSLGKRFVRGMLKLLEYSGHGIPWLIFTVYMICQSSKKKSWIFFCNLLMALIIDLVVVGLLKVIVRRPRPKYNVDDMFATVSIDKHSFPSGHSTRVTMVALLFTHYWSERWCIRLGFMWAGLVATSRVVLGRHHITDVCGGVIIGYLQYCLILQCWLTHKTLTTFANWDKDNTL